MFAERHKETSMSDTKDKNSRGILVDFRSGSEVGESVSEEQGGLIKQEADARLSKDEEKSNEADDKWSLRIIGRKVWKFINTGIGVALLCAVMPVAFKVHDFIRDTERAIDQMATKSDTEGINSQIEDMTGVIKDVIEDYEKLDDTVGDLKTTVEITKNEMYGLKRLKAEPNVAVEILKLSQKDDISSSNQAMWDEGDIVASDEDDIENITAKELENQKMILSYVEGEQEILFYGKFSKNNRWDGNCILNVYLGNELQMVTEAEYDDGKLIGYRQAYTFTTKLEKEVWCISKRECTENGNLGDSWNYYKKEDIEKEYDSEKEDQKLNIVTVWQVQDRVRNNVEGFYHGLTSEGAYNDDTGEAYLVKFSFDGTVRTLYKGNFSDGVFSDTLDQPAWMIGRKEEKIDSKYAYYKGEFNEDGNPANSGGWKYGLEYQDIIEYTSPYFFKCKLKWYGFDNAGTA